jgi:molybdenum cofactor cytidylyltransferase
MIFGPTRLDEALGAVLAHTQRLPDRVLKKGSVLDEAAIAALREAGHAQIIAARLEPGDVPEDIAADRLAEALLSPLIRRSRAATGRVNLVAEAAGLLRLDRVAIDQLNALDESLTLGTLPDYAVVAPKDMLATIKVIPFAAPGAVLDQAEAMARAAPCLRLHQLRGRKVGLVLSTLPGLKDSVISGTIEATAARIAALTGTLLRPRICAHDEAAIAGEISGLLAEGAEMILVCGASAVVDRRDVGPAAIVRAGGKILHFGMPVDPGNLICLGRIGDMPALVLPGCARSPKLNGIDWVLARLFADIAVTGAEIARMGAGGLLKDVETRPLPRARATNLPVPARNGRPRIAGIVLAAGKSSRMAPRNKLLVKVGNGRAMVAQVVDELLASEVDPVLVVTGHMAPEITHALEGRRVTLVPAPDYARGLSASLQAGIAAVPADCAAALVCLGDMPLVRAGMIDRLLAAYDEDEGRTLVIPTYRGKQGNPVLWDRRYFPEIAALSGDVGARQLLALHQDAVAEVEMDDDAVLRDFDTVDTLSIFPEAD